MRIYRAIFWEIVLILASVLVFRGAWVLLDRLIGFGETALIMSLVIGIALSSVSLYAISKCLKEQGENGNRENHYR
ncbi:MAG: hypothetical protein WBF08_05285 [Candidatus Bathyarchaeia archaeon]